MADDLVESGMTIQSDPFGFGMTEEERFNVSAPKLAYDILGDSFFKMTKAQRDYVLELVRSGDLTASEIQQAAEYALPYDPELGRSEQELTYVPPGNNRLFLPEEAKSLRAKEMSEAEFYKTFFNYDYKETEIPQEVREIYAGLMGTSVENTPKTSDNLPRQRIESPTSDSEKRIAMATGGNTTGFPTDVVGNYGSFSTMTPISTQQYLSGPVDFYRETLGTGIQSSVIDDDDEKKEEEEDTAPNIFKPIGSDDGGREDMSTLSLGLDADKSGFDPASVNSYRTYDVKIPGMDYTDAGFFSDQSADLVRDFAGDFFDNLGDINEKGFKGFGDVVSGDVSLSDAIKSFGQGVQMEGPMGKMRTVTAPPAALMVMGPAGGLFGALAALGGAANMAIQKQNAAIFKATGAGAFMDINGMMVSRKPGSFQYSGNLSGMSQEQIKNIEAIKNGFLVGTMKAETYKDGEWSALSGDKDVIQSDDVFRNGGTFNANGTWTDISGQGYATPTKQNVADYTKAFNDRWGTNFSTDFVSDTYKSIETTWGFTTGTTVKPGTKTMQQKMTDAAIADRMSKVGGYQFGDAYAGTSAASTAAGFDSSITPGAAYKRTGMEAFFTEEAKAKRAADAKAEQDRRDRAAAAAAEQQRREEAARSGKTSKSDPYGGDARDGGGAFGGLSDREAESAKGSNPGDKSSWASGGRVGMQAGGEAGFAERPEFVGGNQSQPDDVSIADDQPRDVPEGTFVINAAAADFAGRDDIEKMIRKAYQKIGDTGQSGVSQEVQIAVSKGEVLIPPHIAKIIGYDRLNKINNRGKKEIARRQEAAGGGFIDRKKFADGGDVDNLYTGPLPQPIGFDIVDERIRELGPQGYGILSEKDIRLEEQSRINPATPSMSSDSERQSYRKSVEFGDTEAGFSFLGRTNYNDVLLAGLRDTRTLSDFVKTLDLNEDISGYFGLNPAGAYRENINRVIIKSPEYFATSRSGGLPLSYDAVLGHELMHKGADALAKDPNFKPSETLIKAQRAWKANEESRKGAIGGNTPEHRYIQSIINEAYMLRDVDSVLGSLEKQKRTKEPVQDFEIVYGKDGKVEFEPYFRQVNASDLANAKKKGLIKELRRSFDNYMTGENKKQFLNENKEHLMEGRGGIQFKDRDVPFTTVAGVFRSLNKIMAQDYAAQLFKNAIANKPIEVQRKPDRKPEPQLAPEPKYERGFLEKALGISPAY